MKYKIEFNFQKKHLLILFLAWVIIQALLLYKYGIVTNNEAIKYAREANNFLNHKSFSEQKYIFYSAYIFIHVLFIKSGFETIGVYLFQLLVNLTATYLFYKTALGVYKNNLIAFIAALLLIVCYSWQYWTICLYTESFFCSMLIIYTYCLFGIKKTVSLKYLYAALAFSVLLFSRPTGILLLPVMICLIISRLIASGKYLPAFVSIALLFTAFICLLSFEMKSASSFNFIKPFIEQNVICDIPYKPVDRSINSYSNDFRGVWLYIQQNPFDFLRLCFLRFIAFWGLTRSYYSEVHNWILRLFFYPMYFFALTSLKQQIKLNHNFMLYCLSIIIVFTISVMLTCDEWSSRFIMPIMPIIILLASYGIVSLFKKPGISNSLSLNK
jgi:hypothetical protein